MIKLLLVSTIAAAATVGAAAPYWKSPDPKVCGSVVRDTDGTTLRSVKVLNAFKKAHPCPANGKDAGACPGWAMDHVIPLDCGGCDEINNLQWLPTEQWRMKSKWERKAYGGHGLSKGCP